MKMSFATVLDDGVFPDYWKKGNMAPVHEENYAPIFTKIFDKIIFTSMFEYFIENEFLHFVDLVFFLTILALYSS